MIQSITYEGDKNNYDTIQKDEAFHFIKNANPFFNTLDMYYIWNRGLVVDNTQYFFMTVYAKLAKVKDNIYQ